MNSHQNPSVSIITACFNSAKTIEQTIQSVINQTYPAIEYIILDGGSTDGTVEIIKKHESKIVYWVSEPDQGISDAWNKGIRKATGEYIGFIGADDLYEPEAVETAVAALQKDHSTDFIFGDIHLIDEKLGVKLISYGDPDFEKNLRYEMTIPHLATFVKTETFRKFGLFNTSYQAAMDYDFLLRITRNGLKGKYVRNFFGTMLLGGESNRNFVRCYREMARISISHGGNRIRSYLLFCFKVIKRVTRDFLEKLNLLKVVKYYRKLFGRRYNYDE
jgi:Glycosyltransferases involved in cell wall biogenesis